jgi:hypothetical protein
VIFFPRESTYWKICFRPLRRQHPVRAIPAP